MLRKWLNRAEEVITDECFYSDRVHKQLYRCETNCRCEWNILLISLRSLRRKFNLLPCRVIISHYSADSAYNIIENETMVGGIENNYPRYVTVTQITCLTAKLICTNTEHLELTIQSVWFALQLSSHRNAFKCIKWWQNIFCDFVLK